MGGSAPLRDPRRLRRLSRLRPQSLGGCAPSLGHDLTSSAPAPFALAGDRAAARGPLRAVAAALRSAGCLAGDRPPVGSAAYGRPGASVLSVPVVPQPCPVPPGAYRGGSAAAPPAFGRVPSWGPRPAAPLGPRCGQTPPPDRQRNARPIPTSPRATRGPVLAGAPEVPGTCVAAPPALMLPPRVKAQAGRSQGGPRVPPWLRP